MKMLESIAACLVVGLCLLSDDSLDRLLDLIPPHVLGILATLAGVLIVAVLFLFCLNWTFRRGDWI